MITFVACLSLFESIVLEMSEPLLGVGNRGDIACSVRTLSSGQYYDYIFCGRRKITLSQNINDEISSALIDMKGVNDRKTHFFQLSGFLPRFLAADAMYFVLQDAERCFRETLPKEGEVLSVEYDVEQADMGVYFCVAPR